MDTIAPLVPFTAHDRCDRCGAQAYVRAVFLAGDLLFCAHHGHQYDDALTRHAAAVFTASVPA